MSLRDRRALDPAVERDLLELDRALAGDPAAEPELALLVEDVRALHPELDPGFRARLEGALSEGFPTPPTAERPRRAAAPLAPLRRAQVAVPALAALLAALVVAGGVLREDDPPQGASAVSSEAASGGEGAADERGPTNLDSAGDAAAAGGTAAGATGPRTAGDDAGAAGERLLRELRPAGGAPDVALEDRAMRADPAAAALAPADPAARPFAAPSAPPGGSGGGAALQGAQGALRGLAAGRQVERGVVLELTTAPGDLQDVASGVVRVTQAAGGYVAASQVEATSDGGGATFTLRVPSARLDRTLAQLTDLADVRRLSQSARDITSTVATAADRLADARAERRGVQRALAGASTEAGVRRLRVRLGQLRSREARLRGELEAQRRRAALATVELTLATQDEAADEDGAGTWTPGDALDDAGRLVEVAAGVALVALAALVPLALLALLALAAARTLRRRRRDAALD
jgi:acetolactate synthase regulatory subunit